MSTNSLELKTLHPQQSPLSSVLHQTHNRKNNTITLLAAGVIALLPIGIGVLSMADYLPVTPITYLLMGGSVVTVAGFIVLRAICKGYSEESDVVIRSNAPEIVDEDSQKTQFKLVIACMEKKQFSHAKNLFRDTVCHHPREKYDPEIKGLVVAATNALMLSFRQCPDIKEEIRHISVLGNSQDRFLLNIDRNNVPALYTLAKESIQFHLENQNHDRALMIYAGVIWDIVHKSLSPGSDSKALKDVMYSVLNSFRDKEVQEAFKEIDDVMSTSCLHPASILNIVKSYMEIPPIDSVFFTMPTNPEMAQYHHFTEMAGAPDRDTEVAMNAHFNEGAKYVHDTFYGIIEEWSLSLCPPRIDLAEFAREQCKAGVVLVVPATR